MSETNALISAISGSPVNLIMPPNHEDSHHGEEALNLSQREPGEVKLSAKMRLKKQRLIEIEKENSRLRNLVAAAETMQQQEQQQQKQRQFHNNDQSALHRLAEAAERKQVRL